MTHNKKSPLKSVVEEASSVAKAIEKAWTRVGKPADFSIKVLELEQKNFLGMSVKPAKVGIFFQAPLEKERATVRPEHTPRPERKERHDRADRQDKVPFKSERAERPMHSAPSVKDSNREQRGRKGAPEQSSTSARWSDAMVHAVRTWLETTMRLIGKEDCSFETQVHNYHLKIIFSKSIFDDREKERNFFRIASYLIMQALRTSSKEGFRGFKILMSSDVTTP